MAFREESGAAKDWHIEPEFCYRCLGYIGVLTDRMCQCVSPKQETKPMSEARRRMSEDVERAMARIEELYGRKNK